MKLPMANLIGAFTTLGLWAILMTFSMLSFTNGIVLMIIGLGLVSLLMVNVVGSIIGLVTVIREVDSVEAWFGLCGHVIQFCVITAVTILGLLADA